MSDIRVAMARKAHQDSLEKRDEAHRFRQLRDNYIRELRADDPKRWTYQALADQVGCSLELVAYIVRGA